MLIIRKIKHYITTPNITMSLPTAITSPTSFIIELKCLETTLDGNIIKCTPISSAKHSRNFDVVAAILREMTPDMLFRFHAFRVRSAEYSPGIALRTALSAGIPCRRGIFPGNLPLRTHPK